MLLAGGAGVKRCTRERRGSVASAQPLLAEIKHLSWDVREESGTTALCVQYWDSWATLSEAGLKLQS